MRRTAWLFSCWNCGTKVLGRVGGGRRVLTVSVDQQLLRETEIRDAAIDVRPRPMRCAACRQEPQPNYAVPICPLCAEMYLDEDEIRGPCSLCREEYAHQRDVDRQYRRDAAKYY